MRFVIKIYYFLVLIALLIFPPEVYIFVHTYISIKKTSENYINFTYVSQSPPPSPHLLIEEQHFQSKVPPRHSKHKINIYLLPDSKKIITTY